MQSFCYNQDKEPRQDCHKRTAQVKQDWGQVPTVHWFFPLVPERRWDWCSLKPVSVANASRYLRLTPWKMSLSIRDLCSCAWTGFTLTFMPYLSPENYRDVQMLRDPDDWPTITNLNWAKLGRIATLAMYGRTQNNQIIPAWFCPATHITPLESKT